MSNAHEPARRKTVHKLACEFAREWSIFAAAHGVAESSYWLAPDGGIDGAGPRSVAIIICFTDEAGEGDDES